jgi:GAF domain-containing protein
VAHLLGQTPAGLTVRAGRPLFVPRVTPERIRNLVHEHYWPTIERMRIQSLIVVPLRARGRPVGAILAARDDGGPGYSAEDVVFLQQLAGRVALAVANARECSCALTSLPAGLVTRALAG